MFLVTVSVNDALMGSATGGGYYEYGTTATLTATPTSGYRFVKWSDETTVTPYVITVTKDVTLTAVFEAIPCSFDGNCGASGDNLTWELSCEGELTISGSGAMADYADEASVPWYSHRDDIVSLVLPDGITTIGSYAFFATNITSITVPEGVTSLGAAAFMECQSLRTIVLPGSLTSIGAQAIAYCGALERIECNATTPPTLASDALQGDCYRTAYVPCAGLEAYQAAAEWEDLDNVFPLTAVSITYSVVPSDVEMGTAGATAETEYCDRTEITVQAVAESGYRFVKWSDESTENPHDMILTSDQVITATFEADVDAGNLQICIGLNEFTVTNNPYAANIVLHNAANTLQTTVKRKPTPQIVSIPAEWPTGSYIVEFDGGDRAFIVTKE